MRPLFLIRNLSKVFPNGNTALDGVDLEIAEGQCLLVAGSNGSGKTILMRILAGLADPSGGELLFRGAPLAKALEKAGNFRQELGIVFQDADSQFVGETVEEDVSFGPSNLALNKEEVEARTREALVKTGLWEKRTFPPRRLSGGEKRRLAIAGVLAMNCRIIIMDEPFANLDWPGVVQVLRGIEALKKDGKTLIILTHELEKALALGDRLVILDRGRIRDSGKPEEVLDRLRPEYGVRDPRRSYGTVEDCSWLD
ncbi:MAG: energy-coupling factor ABC transporter ATP-binding protein [Treponema sp.]|jgi:biotin transport system ATP-binding protein|nr:energy-coupling factor ABC transporter ATP-binding protein [Treponema sp.]